MFQVGDKIFYPMYGAGVIEDIEEKEILGEKQLYYIFNVSHNNMQVMIPMGKTENLGIREVVDSDTLEEALKVFEEDEVELNDNRHQRYHLNVKKMKSGDIHQGVQVIRDLAYLSKNKKISSEDKMMLDKAVNIFTSEVVLVKGINEEQASEYLDAFINK